MAGGNRSNRRDDDVHEVEDEDGQGRQRSTIGFPYMDLNDAIEVAQAIHDNVGHGECDEDQLAAWLDISPKSSGFRARIATARMFGVIEGSGPLRATSLGQAVVDPNRSRAARVQAFLNVPLYSAVFEKYRGGMLPPAAAFERDIEGLGVAEKQKSRARQVFERAAEQAGFSAQGKNRLVKPGIAEGGEGGALPKKEKLGGGGDGGDLGSLHPFIQGLLKTLPEPETEWKVVDRAKWLQTAANIFDLIYKGDGGIKIEAAGAQRSPRPE